MELDSYLSEQQKKRKERRRYAFVFLVCLIIYALLVGASWLVLRSPLLYIKKITIEGNKAVPNERVMDLLWSRIIGGKFANALLGFNNILIWPKEISPAGLFLFPEIKSLEISKDYKTMAVSVRVTEREPYGIWCLWEPQMNADVTQINADNSTVGNISGNQRQNPRISAVAASDECRWFDDDGVLFRRAVAAEGGLITTVDDYSQKNLGLYSTILPQELVPNAFSAFNVLKSSGLNIKEIRLNDLALQELEVLTYDGPKFYFSLRFPADNDLTVIQNLMAAPNFNKLQYLDFRVENRAYYK